MSVEYMPAPEVQQVATPLIKKYHSHLLDERIEYVFRSETAESGGKAIWGKARKISGLNAYLSRDEDEGGIDPYFVIEIARPVWSLLDDGQRAALVDHELSHCTHKENAQGDRVIALQSHDVEEFKSIIERHGLWRPDLEEFVKAGTEQLRLVDA